MFATKRVRSEKKRLRIGLIKYLIYKHTRNNVMAKSKLTALNAAKLIGLSIFSLSSVASEQPNAAELVGKVYIGAHGMYLKTDGDRQLNSNADSAIDHASGLGAEIGYRASETIETRLSYTHLKPVAEYNNYDVPAGKSVALDLLYFPFKESFYVVGGVDLLDVEQAEISADLGAGYRHYLSKNMAVYFEGKGHYQLEDNYKDFSTKLGFIYYFGTQKSSVRRSAPVATKQVEPTAYVAPVAVTGPIVKDSDNDGVIDTKDQCANTPTMDKVDGNGCTIFTEQQETVSLEINFDNSKSTVKPKYNNEIGKVAEFMNTYPQTNLTINGHSSAQGSAKFNQKLSAQRAQAIVDVLVNKFSIDANRLEAIGHGESQLLNTENTAAAHEQNRRIEASIVTVKQVVEKR